MACCIEYVVKLQGEFVIAVTSRASPARKRRMNSVQIRGLHVSRYTLS
jgi:hypothetical protein